MKFGVFDHMDRGARPLMEQYESRLKLIEAYDRAGFYAYHLAEHHATPLGMAPSSSVFLAAVAQRTKRLRFGPLVYILSLQNPLRVYEEVCMLDQMSGGRLELGIGRGVSPIEVGYYGTDPGQSKAIYLEARDVLLRAFSSQTLTFEGKYFHFKDVPIEMSPVQRPHPPLWLGIGDADGARAAAQTKINMVCNGSTAQVRGLTDRYREEWSKAGGLSSDVPILGMNRHIVIAETEQEAMAAAKSAYESWHANLDYLWVKNATKPPHSYPAKFEDAVRSSFCIVGTPRTVRDMVAAQVKEAGINYLMCRLAFGDLTHENALRSVELFVRDVMPQFKPAQAA
jgi:alkanesulfonate monooxygenase SsuD/methylene tetrahydromethanopterin reductase-like flavin-dependent oxidoreductase (luciferase family)